MDASNTKITIINKALSHIKQRTITSLDEQSEQARKANLFYDCARRSALRGCDWRWATVKKPLTLLGTQEDGLAYPDDNSKQDYLQEWSYTHAYPQNCVRFRRIFNPSRRADESIYIEQHQGDHPTRRNNFEIARSPVTNVICIGSEIELAWAEYTYDITDESQFDDMFQDALAWELAAELAIPLCCDLQLQQSVKQDAKEAMDEARRKNGGEGTEMQPRQSNYDAARMGGYYGPPNFGDTF
jgi:hypothetical protein